MRRQGKTATGCDGLHISVLFCHSTRFWHGDECLLDSTQDTIFAPFIDFTDHGGYLQLLDIEENLIWVSQPFWPMHRQIGRNGTNYISQRHYNCATPCAYPLDSRPGNVDPTLLSPKLGRILKNETESQQRQRLRIR